MSEPEPNGNGAALRWLLAIGLPLVSSSGSVGIYHLAHGQTGPTREEHQLLLERFNRHEDADARRDERVRALELGASGTAEWRTSIETKLADIAANVRELRREKL